MAATSPAPWPAHLEHVTRDLDTGLPVLTFAEDFFAFASLTGLTDDLRTELVESAAAGPMRRRSDYDAGPVDDLAWFTAALAIEGLTEDNLNLLSLSFTEGPLDEAGLGELSRRLLTHPACTDAAALRLLESAGARKDLDGSSPKADTVLAELDKAAHPAATLWRITWARGVDWEPRMRRHELLTRLRELGPTGCRAADHLVGSFTGDLGTLLEIAAGIAAEPSHLSGKDATL